MSKYQIGDKVKLKSGVPVMTVHQVNVHNPIQYRGNLRCQWFAGKKLEEGYFPDESLEDAQDDNQ
ncbi:YodC family protein [Klebsiella variicola]|uniref:YodC family protein n=1 Tax=Klebsiella variicola TaxID=244366 RepID=UPI0034D21DC1